MNEIPVSDAPTTTIRLLLPILLVFRRRFVIIDSENGGSY